MRALTPFVLVMLSAAHVHAQDSDLRVSNLPRDVVRHIEMVRDHPATRHYSGEAVIAAGDTIAAPVVLSGGTLTVAGTIRGELILLSGDVTFEPGAVVDGDVTLVEGRMIGEDNARIGGSITVYGEGFALLARAERYHGARDRWERDADWQRNGDFDFTLRVADNYNRVEGLPVQFGPDIRTGGPWSTRVQGLAVWRTELGPFTESRHMGYIARAEQFLGGETLRVGAALHSLIQPIESWGLSDLEASLAAAGFHDDQRDYFEREGWTVYTRLTPPGIPLDARIEYRAETHATVPVRSPWTLFNDDRDWRPQPHVAEGDVRTLRGSVAWDARRGDEFNVRGWYAKAELAHALGGQLRLARPALSPGEVDADFTTAMLDLRRYDRAGRSGILALRVLGGGAVEEHALPPQYQHALGGPGSLPGLPLFAADCGARRSFTFGDDGDLYFPAYGCERFALAQVEYRGGFDLRFGGHDHDHDDDREHRRYWLDSDVDWTVFFDAARGWAYHRDAGSSDTGNVYDVGAGIVLGGLGIYGAVPIGTDHRGLRFFVRLGPRF